MGNCKSFKKEKTKGNHEDMMTTEIKDTKESINGLNCSWQMMRNLNFQACSIGHNSDKSHLKLNTEKVFKPVLSCNDCQNDDIPGKIKLTCGHNICVKCYTKLNLSTHECPIDNKLLININMNKKTDEDEHLETDKNKSNIEDNNNEINVVENNNIINNPAELITHCKNNHELKWIVDKKTCSNHKYKTQCIGCKEDKFYLCLQKCLYNSFKKDKCFENHDLLWCFNELTCSRCNEKNYGFTCQYCYGFYLCVRCANYEFNYEYCPNRHKLKSGYRECSKCLNTGDGYGCSICNYFVCNYKGCKGISTFDSSKAEKSTSIPLEDLIKNKQERKRSSASGFYKNSMHDHFGDDIQKFNTNKELNKMFISEKHIEKKQEIKDNKNLKNQGKIPSLDSKTNNGNIKTTGNINNCQSNNPNKPNNINNKNNNMSPNVNLNFGISPIENNKKTVKRNNPDIDISYISEEEQAYNKDLILSTYSSRQEFASVHEDLFKSLRSRDITIQVGKEENEKELEQLKELETKQDIEIHDIDKPKLIDLSIVQKMLKDPGNYNRVEQTPDITIYEDADLVISDIGGNSIKNVNLSSNTNGKGNNTNNLNNNTTSIKKENIKTNLSKQQGNTINKSNYESCILNISNINIDNDKSVNQGDKSYLKNGNKNESIYENISPRGPIVGFLENKLESSNKIDKLEIELEPCKPYPPLNLQPNILENKPDQSSIQPTPIENHNDKAENSFLNNINENLTSFRKENNDKDNKDIEETNILNSKIEAHNELQNENQKHSFIDEMTIISNHDTNQPHHKNILSIFSTNNDSKNITPHFIVYSDFDYKLLNNKENAASVEKLYNKGIQYYNKNNFTEAENCFNNILEKEPELSMIYNSLGLIYKKQNKLNESEIYFAKSIKLNPKLKEAYINLALLLKSQKKYNEAEECYKNLLRIDPEHKVAHFNLGNTLDEQGKYESAIKCYMNAINIDPVYKIAYFNLGNTYDEQGDFENAIKCYNEAIKIDPKYKRAYFNLGVAYGSLNKYEESIKNYNEVIKLDKKFKDAYNNIGVAYYKLRKYKMAVINYQKAIAVDNNFKEAYNNLGNTLLSQGKLDEAQSSFETAVSIDSSYKLAKYNLEQVKKKISLNKGA